MKRIALAVAALLGLLACASSASATTYQLQSNTKCAVSWAEGYGGNVTCSDMYVVINGVQYYVSVSAHIMPDDTLYAPLSAITFEVLGSGNPVSYQLTGTFTGTPPTYQVNGAFTIGSVGDFVKLNITHYPGRYGGTFIQANSTVTLN